MNNIGVIIVTYNRLEKLKKCLKLFDTQTVKPKYIIVINNKSTDNTKEYLENWVNLKSQYEKYNVETESNLGGSGGFYTGLKLALNLEADWIYVSDDDAFPENDVIERSEKFLETYSDKENLAAFCTKVVKNGNIDYSHRVIIKEKLFRIVSKKSTEADYSKDYFETNTFTYVGAIMNKKFLEKYGITKKEYFLYWDDFEHSYRLSKHGKILCVPNIIVHHDANTGGKSKFAAYYFTRNKLIWYKSLGKKFYYYELIRQYIYLLAKIILRYNVENHEMIKLGIKDARNDKMGKCDKQN